MLVAFGQLALGQEESSHCVAGINQHSFQNQW
jgi:hypothetical protein